MADDQTIAMALANLNALRNPLFPDQKAFDITVRHLVENYKTPLKESVSITKSLLVTAIEDSAKEYLDTYPKLQSEVVYLISKNLNICEEITWNHLDAHIEAQKAFMNTQHEQFKQEMESLMPYRPKNVQVEDFQDPQTNDSGDSSEDDDDESSILKGKMLLRTMDLDEPKFINIFKKKIQVFESESDSENPLVEFSKDLVKTSAAYDVKGKVFTIRSNDGQSLIHGLSKIALVATQNADDWTEAFKKSGFIREVAHERPTSIEKRFDKEVLQDPFLSEYTDKTHQMVKKYMKIVDTTILDLTPKYIKMSLINAVS